MSAGGVVTLGETMALMTPTTTGPLQHTRTMTLGIGGSESNVAIALQRLGTPATWIGKVGSDSLGDLVAREIGAEGVRVVALRDQEVPTGLMVKERRTSADTRVWYYRSGSAGSRLRADELDAALIRESTLLHVTGISPALSESMAGAVFEAIRVARDAGILVSFDLNFRSRLWSRELARECYLRLLPEADIVFAGDDEAAIVVEDAANPLTLAHRLVDAGAGQAIVKLGARGAVAVVDGAEYERAAISVTVIDTVGAGDAFVAGYLADFLAGEDVPTRLTTAVTVGAYACLTEGDWEGSPRREELARLGDSGHTSR